MALRRPGAGSDTSLGHMSEPWPRGTLLAVERSPELEIAARRTDGRLLRFTPVWVVCCDDRVFVRTWYRRDTGWYGHAVASRGARVRVETAEFDVSVTAVGATDTALRGAVDEAYRAKYGRSGSVERMIGSDAASTTLLLEPVAPT